MHVKYFEIVKYFYNESSYEKQKVEFTITNNDQS